MKRKNLLKCGYAFLLLGVIFLILSNPTCKIIGGAGYLIGAVVCSIYNFEKRKFFKTLRNELAKRRYDFPVRPIAGSIICLVCLFFSASLVWGYLAHTDIVSFTVFKVVGILYWIPLIPCLLNRQVDSIDMELINTLIRMKENYYKQPQ